MHNILRGKYFDMVSEGEDILAVFWNFVVIG